ncbi:hypothetical protein OROGR_027785 [Orobanche gracilis]
MDDKISHSSLPKRRSFTYSSCSNVSPFTSDKSVYGGVFGAPTRLGHPTLAPRLEDYSEIFGGFHAPRSFSIPVIELPISGDDSIILHFDCTEVFGDSRGVDFVSFEDLVGHSGGGHDISEAPWSPAESGSISNQFDALAGSDKSLRLSDGDARKLMEMTTQFNALYSKCSPSNIGTVLTETSYVTNFSALPRYTFSPYESPVSWDREYENCSVSVIDDLDSCKEYGKRVAEEKQYTKHSANSIHSGLNAPRNDFNLLEKHGCSTSKPLMTLSDINLQTKPSRLQPPSRPPPALLVRKGGSDGPDLKLKPSKGYASERVADVSTLFFVDVEVDATLPSKGTKNGNKNVKVKHECIKESIERKGIQSDSAMPLEEKTNKTVRVSSSIMDEMPVSHGKETPTLLPGIGDGIESISHMEGVRYHNHSVAWREETEYFEVFEKNASQEASDTTVQHMNGDAYRHRNTKGKEIEKTFIDAQTTEITSVKYKQNISREKCQRKLEDMEGEETKDRVTWRTEAEVLKEQHTGASGKETENKLKETHDANENKMVTQEVIGHAEETEPIERNEHEKEADQDVDVHVLIEDEKLKECNGGCKFDEGTAPVVSGKCDNEGIGQLEAEPSKNTCETRARVEVTLVKGKPDGFSTNGNELDGITRSDTNNNVESYGLPKQMMESNVCGSSKGPSCVMADNMSSTFSYCHEPEKIMSTEGDQGSPIKGTQFISKRLDITDTFTPFQAIRESTLNGRKMGDASSLLKHRDDKLYLINIDASERMEIKGYNMKENLSAKDQKIGDRIRREIELENEQIRKVEEEKEREREREKDRMAVDKEALEAHERSYVEARERSERAVMQRGSAEVRQRAMVGARERLEKASIEAKLRIEQAAVERATAVARQLASRKSMAQKAAFGASARVERYVPDRFPASFRSADTRQNSLSSDIHSQSNEISKSLRYSYSSTHVGADGESLQKSTARLERFRITAERAVEMALAEKNMRDLLAQREREEVNRVAESLDVEVKRWSSGKEGNLRALLSTLQYILGPGSGWQPVPLTEVVNSAAVKKAYRKATLCVHPDKLQQRGATIQQKYICDKVFDLLKEAWNKFNSEELGILTLVVGWQKRFVGDGFALSKAEFRIKNRSCGK